MRSKFDQMGLLVSMATDRVIVGKTASTRFLELFYWIHFILAGEEDIHKSLIGEIGQWTKELAALECLKKNRIDL